TKTASHASLRKGRSSACRSKNTESCIFLHSLSKAATGKARILMTQNLIVIEGPSPRRSIWAGLVEKGADRAPIATSEFDESRPGHHWDGNPTRAQNA